MSIKSYIQQIVEVERRSDTTIRALEKSWIRGIP